MKKKLISGGLLIAGLILLSGSSYSKATTADVRVKEDYVKIYDVKYKSVDASKWKPGTVYIGKEFPVLQIDIEGYDQQDIKYVLYQIDDDLRGGSYWFGWRKKPHRTMEREVCELKRFYEEDYGVSGNPNLKKGSHTLKAILIDCKGNKVEDTYVFKVK